MTAREHDRLATFHPAYFGLVMATGMVSIACPLGWYRSCGPWSGGPARGRSPPASVAAVHVRGVVAQELVSVRLPAELHFGQHAIAVRIALGHEPEGA